MDLYFSFPHRNFSQSKCVNIGFPQTISVFSKTIANTKTKLSIPIISFNFCSICFIETRLQFFFRWLCLTAVGPTVDLLVQCMRTNEWLRFETEPSTNSFCYLYIVPLKLVIVFFFFILKM